MSASNSLEQSFGAHIVHGSTLQSVHMYISLSITGYYHQVNSYGSNNIAVAILFSRLDNLQQYNNTGCESKQLHSIPLSHLDVDWKYPGYGRMTMGNTHLETAR